MYHYLPYLFNDKSFNKNVKAIILSAGAAKGFYQLGALHYLFSNSFEFSSEFKIEKEENTILNTNKLNVYCGTSVGAAIAGLLACGYTPIDLFVYTCTEDINECWKYDWSIKRLLFDYGIISIKQMRNYIEKAIIHKFGYIPTFEELYFITGNIFICPAWKLNEDKSMVYFSYKTTPDVNILDAICASSALPIIFTKCMIEDDYYIDGGMFDRLCVNHTIDFLESEHFDIDELYIIDGASDSSNKNKIETLLDYIKKIMFVPFYMQPKLDLSKYKSKYKIYYFKLMCQHFEITLSLPLKQRIENFCEGYSQTKKQIENKEY